VYFVVPDSAAQFPYALGVSGKIRGCLPDAVVETDLTGRGIPKGLARAGLVLSAPSSYGFAARGVFAVLVGDREREQQAVTVKDLSTGRQETYPVGELAARLAAPRPS